MAEKILKDFIESSKSFEFTPKFIKKANHFMETYENKNIPLKTLLNYIVKENKQYLFNNSEQIVEVYKTVFTFPSYEQRQGVMIEVKSNKENKLDKFFLMKSCFETRQPDTFLLSETFSKINSKLTIKDFEKLLENIFYIW